MRMLEILGNETDTMCRLIGSRATLGAARKLADQMMAIDMARDEPRYISIDVDNGRGTVLYTITPVDLVASQTMVASAPPMMASMATISR